MSYDIRLKRVYEPEQAADGARVLVDRLWPRGKRKDALALTEWLREVAPSSTLRQAWHRGKLDADAFAGDYLKELQEKSDELLPLMRHARQGTLTLLTATRDPEHSHLPILRRALLRELQREDEEAEGRDPSSPVCYGKGD